MYSYLIFFGAFLSFPLFSSIVVKLSDMHTMAKRSDAIFHAYVGEKKVIKDRLGRPVTLTQVEIIDGLHGEAKNGDVVTIYQVGGEQDGLITPIMGGQNFEVGQELIFFGLRLGTNFVSYGAGQGKFDVVDFQGHEFVREDLGDVSALRNRSELYSPMPLMFENKELLKNEIRLMLGE